MTRRYTQPAPMNGLAGLSYPVVPPPAPVPTSPRGRLRRHALALAIVAATGGLVLMPQTSLAAQCARADSDGGKTVRFDRPAGVGPGTRYRYPDPSGEFDSKDHNRVEVGNCYVPIGSTAVTTADAITVDVNVTDLYGNGNQSVGGTNPRDVFVGSIDLRERTVTDPNARNVITIKGINRYGNIFGPGGVAPTTLNLEGMRIDGLYVVSASDDDVIRNGDIINIREGADIRTYVYAGGGNDTLNLEGGYAREVYGDNRNGFDAATLEDPANSFNDVFNIRDGTYIGVNGDSGSDRSGYAAGNDVFNLHGGTITTLEGDGGNDTFNFLGPITVRDAFGDAGDDLFVLESSVDPTLLWNIAGDDGSDYPATGNGGDRIQIKGLVLRASSDRNTRPDANQNNVTSIRAMNVVELLDGTQLTMYDNAEGSDAMSSFRLGRPTGDPEDDKLLIDATSALIHLGKYTQGSTESSRDASINYNVQNLGTIDLGQDAPGTRMTIRGNYIGGGRLLMSTYLGDDSSESDVLILLGNASGSTVLDIKPVAGSPGGQTVEGITLVDIDPTKAIAADAFVLAAPITTENGLWQYRLARNATTQDFVLTSGVAPPPPAPPPPAPPPPAPPPPAPPPPAPPPPAPPPPAPPPPAPPPPAPPPPAPPPPAPPPPAPPPPAPPPPAPPPPAPPPPAPPPPAPPPPAPPPPAPPPPAPPPPSPPPAAPPPGDHLLHPRTSVYAMGVVTAQGLAMDSLGTASERAGVGGEVSTGHLDGLWMRARYATVESGRGQFSADQSQFSLRAGRDLLSDSGSRTGVMAVVASGSAEVSDHVRPTVTGFANPLAANVGDVRSTLLGVGVYRTWTASPGGYFDLTGQIGRLWLSNRASEGTMDDRSGWSAVVSAEAGRRFAVGAGQWSITPQAQLLASHVRLGSVNDGTVGVDGSRMTAYRARVGLHFGNSASQGTGPRFHGLANVWHNLSKDADTTLHGGNDTIVIAPQFSRTWLEAGVGLEWPTAAAGRFSVDLRGQRGLGGDDRRALGVQAHWQLNW